MILLLGGTSETALFATAIAERGYPVIVSTATGFPLEIGKNPAIRRRTGPLNEEKMGLLVREEGIRAIIDVTHPYAALASATAKSVAEQAGIPYLRWVRSQAITDRNGIILVRNHFEAAETAFAHGSTVFLTTGSKNLTPYVEQMQLTGTTLIIRVLPYYESIEACRRAGIPPQHTIAGRGPFTVEENRALIRKFGIGIIVTKDSGTAGGTQAKIESARLENCRIVVVQRPDEVTNGRFSEPEDLLKALEVQFEDKYRFQDRSAQYNTS